jgi:peptidyl-prolyl cis-trans isomerase D
MLNTIRENAGGPAAKILIGVLVMAFAVWGIADIFRGFSSDVIVTAGSTEIPAERFNAEYRRNLNDLSERIGQPISPAEGRQYGLDRRVIAQLAGAAVLSEEAENLGLAVSNTIVAADIRSDETFHGAFGKFDRQTFELALAQNQISETAFVNDRREFMTRDQLLNSVVAGAATPDGLAEALYEYRYEQRTVRYLVLPPDLVDEIADPSEEEITAYHQQAALRFTTPETRSFSVLMIKPEDIVPTIAIDEAVLLETFEDRRDEFDKPETRNVIQIPSADDEKATEIVTRLRNGDKIEDVLSETGLSIDDVTLSDVTIRNFLSTEIADTAFALEEGEVSDPVEGPLGPVVLIVTGISPAVPAEFEDVKDDIKTELVAGEAADAVFDLYNKIEDERAGGATLAEISNNLGIDLVSIDETTSQGLTAAGPPPANMPAIPTIVSEVFANDVGIEVPAGELADDGYYWIEVTSVSPAALKPLEEVRDDVVDLWKREQRKVKLDELARSLVERGNKGEPIDAMARSFTRAVQTSPAMLRRFSNETFSRIGVNNVFSTPVDDFTYALAGFGDSMVLMQVTTVETPEQGNGTIDLEEIKLALKETASDDLISSLVVALQEKYQVEVNYGLIDQILSPGTDG